MVMIKTMERLVEAIQSVPLPDNTTIALGRVPNSSNTTCKYRGEFIEKIDCAECTGKVELKVYECPIYKRCSIGKVPDTITKSCSSCHERRTNWPIQYDEGNLWYGAPGKRFNPSIVEWRGNYAFVFRNGWAGSQIFLGFLNRNFEPIGGLTKLELNDPGCNYGCEDPRLLIHKGKLTLVFTGVVGGNRILHTNVMLATINDNLRVDSLYCPYIEGRNLWEKNHSYFSQKENLWAVYSINPHRVMRVIDGKGEWTYEEPGPKWSGGELRGGAPPVLVGDEYWSFCHDRVHSNGMLTYRTILYTFSIKPPFRPMRIIPQPILTANQNNRPSDQYCACVFAGGTIKSGDDWIIAHGIHDRWSELHKFSHNELESKLVEVT